MNCDLVLVARTDALSANLLDSNIDPVDHPFIVGIADRNQPDKLITFVEAGKAAINQKLSGGKRDEMLKKWEELSMNMSLNEAKEFA